MEVTARTEEDTLVSQLCSVIREGHVIIIEEMHAGRGLMDGRLLEFTRLSYTVYTPHTYANAQTMSHLTHFGSSETSIRVFIKS